MNLGGFNLDDLQRSQEVSYAIDGDFRLIYANRAWEKFAVSNNLPGIASQWPVGSDITTAISPPLRDYYRAAYKKVMTSHKVWSHNFHCSNPEHFRMMRQMAYPLRNTKGVLIVNSLIEQARHKDSLVLPSMEDFIQQGIITMCSHCRRAWDCDGAWIFVPAWVQKPPRQANQGLCHNCLEHYYPQ